MKTTKPQLPKGTRDFNALQVAQRNFIFETIRQIYQPYGFSPLETPALEQLATLTGQYGQEGEQLIFKVLNSGDFLADIDPQAINQGYKALLPQIAEKGLRYDLTVPLMRYIATHQQALIFPFRRYQIQPVWRADRPQKGRYREFYQCDADIVGTSSLLCEAEILAMAYQVLQRLGLTEACIQLNHRGLLKGMVKLIGSPDQENDFCVAIDKLDKLGKGKVFEELISRGFSAASLESIQFIFDLQGNNQEKLDLLEQKLSLSAEGLKGLQELKQIFHYIEALGLADMPISLEPTLARGLSYYTGAVFEIKLPSIHIGSIGGGGRYDHLAEQFGVNGLTGVGFSFGIDRLYTAMEELALFPNYSELATQVLFTNLDPEAEQIALNNLLNLRRQGISLELYLEQTPLKKQLNYAHKKQIPWVVIIGTEEKATARFILKDMQSGHQDTYALDQLFQVLIDNLQKNHQ
jgi:histidyl-tRNA synthetase